MFYNMKKFLVISIFCCIFAVFFTACTLFKVTAGRVNYVDTQRQLELTADTLTIVNERRK